jgi:hypothetical protein
MTQALFWTLIVQPSAIHTGGSGPTKIQGFLTDLDARTYYDKQYGPNQYWEFVSIEQEPLGDPISETYYVVVDGNGRCESGSYSHVSPKLYRLKDAKAVAKKDSKSYYRSGQTPSRVFPVTLNFGDPIT